MADPAAPFAQAYATPGWSATTARRCRSRSGNLVFVSALRNSDVDPMAIRLVLLRHHYRSDWEWTDAELWDAVDTLDRLAPGAVASAPAPRPRRWSTAVLAALADDLDAPRAVAAVAGLGRRHPRRRGGHLADNTDPDAAADACTPLLDAALGLALSRRAGSRRGRPSSRRLR